MFETPEIQKLGANGKAPAAVLSIQFLRFVAAFAVVVEPALGIEDGSGAEAGVAPHDLPGLEFGGDGPLPRKPDPAGLQALQRLAGAATEETLLVGDSAIDVETGRRAGVRLCLARYGFGFHPDRIEIRDSDLVVDDSRDLERVLSGVLADRSRA